MAPTGYSSTPLTAKLCLKQGSRIYLLGAPRGYRDLLAPIPAGVVFMSRLTVTTDLVHCFCTSRARLARALSSIMRRMRPDAIVWVSWPKRAAGVTTDLSEQGVRDLALPLGLVDVKVCAVDETWSGLKLVIRRQLR